MISDKDVYTVCVREYNVCLGDNPSVSRGAPISLDWRFKTEVSYELDDYEQHFSSNSNSSKELDFVDMPNSSAVPLQQSYQRRTTTTTNNNNISIVNTNYDLTNHNQQLKRPSLERFHLLKKIGYSRSEINEASLVVEKIRKQRFQTRRKLERIDSIRSFFFFFRNNNRSSIFGCCSSNNNSFDSSSLSISVSPTLHCTSNSNNNNNKDRNGLLTHRDSLQLPKKERKRRTYQKK